MHARSGRGRAMARAALAGNPSDGYGGAVLALTVNAFAAEVEVADADRDEHPGGGVGALTGAALARMRREHGALASGVCVRCTTSIPERVGLGGSSAIVIATLRALCDLHRLELGPDELARVAWEAETDELGIAAGPQDRYVQAHEGLVLMDFATAPDVARLDASSLPPLFIAYRADAAESSGAVHSDLRGRAASDAAVASAMRELAELAREAAAALARGDVGAFGACMDGSFDARRQIMALDPRHERMIEIARSFGAAANYAGSGGAIVGIRPRRWGALHAELAAEGCEALELDP